MPVYPYPQKRFGQNFLTNKHLSKKIIASLELSKTDVVIEIGPGRGILTELLNTIDCKHKIAVEIDRQLSSHLVENFKDIEIIQKDILEYSFQEQYDKLQSKLKVVGNIPYNITSPILFYLLENSNCIDSAILMIQKEVAERLIAKKDSKEYGILTILVNIQAQVTKLFSVKRTNFYPQPNVDSIVIKLDFFKPASTIENYDIFKKIVKGTFNNRRKMIKNSLKNIMDENKLKKIESVPLKLRPENLSIDDFLNLANEIAIICK